MYWWIALHRLKQHKSCSTRHHRHPSRSVAARSAKRPRSFQAYLPRHDCTERTTEQNDLETEEEDAEVWRSEKGSHTEPPPSKKLRMTPVDVRDTKVSPCLLGYNSRRASTTRALIAQQMRSIEHKLTTMGKVFTDITCFYHTTKPKYKKRIVQDKRLKRSMPDLIHQSRNSPIDQRLEGVFFGCNTLHGKLPSKSPYGSQRILIPIQKFARKSYRLFYNSNHTVGRLNYIILVLAQKDIDDCQFCYENLVELNMTSNPFLRLNFGKNSFRCCQTQPIPTWVELLVLEDISLEERDGHSWDTVTNTGKNKLGKMNKLETRNWVFKDEHSNEPNNFQHYFCMLNVINSTCSFYPILNLHWYIYQLKELFEH